MTMPERRLLFVTGHAPAYRRPAFELLAELEGAEFALFGGALRHGGQADGDVALAAPCRQVSEREVYGLAASGEHRAVVGSTAGRAALLGAYAGARRAGIPFVLWASLWAHPRSAAHLLGYPLMRRIYRRADAVVTYGPHVSAYVRSKGATNVFEAWQAADGAVWDAPRDPQGAAGARDAWGDAPFRVLFAGREHPEKGLGVLRDAWRVCAAAASDARLVLAGVDPAPGSARDAGGSSPIAVGRKDAAALRNLYDAADVVVVPSIRTRDFREPWGLVVNEAFARGVPVIATDEVGAVAGGLLRHERNGLVVAAGDAGALARAILRLRDAPELRARLGAAAAGDIGAHTPRAWTDGFSRALRSLGASSRP